MSRSEGSDNASLVEAVETAIGVRLPASVLSRLRLQVRAEIESAKDETLSIAVVDRTALQRTINLISGQLGSGDPFIAFADFAAILGAVLFNDYVIALGNSEVDHLADDANKLFGLESVIRPVSFAFTQEDSAIGNLVNALIDNAHDVMRDASTVSAAWLGVLRSYWRQLLPASAEFPIHHGPRFAEVSMSIEAGPLMTTTCSLGPTARGTTRTRRSTSSSSTTTYELSTTKA
jgi:hypothetical protein